MTSTIVTPARRVTRIGVSVEVRGAGDPVLLMHGIGGSARSCAALAQILADDGFQTICWDAPGYGESTDPTGAVDLPEVVAGVLDDLDVSSAHLFGTSWGGVLAADVALRRPDRVRSLTLADSSRGSGTSASRADAMRQRAEELRTSGAQALAARRAPRLVSDAADPTVAAAVHADMARVRPAGYGMAAHYMAGTDLGARLHLIQAPTLIVVGADDVVTGVEESRLLADAIPEARLAMIIGAGHAAVQERPDAMAAHVRRFLAGVTR